MAKEMGYVFRCSDIQKKSFNFFEDMKNKKELCDIVFQVGNESISAHRIIITAVIPYFRDILSSSYEQRNTESISIPDIEPSAFKCLIEFAYKCQVKIDTENARNLLAASCYLGVNEVRKACCDFLAEGFEPNNMLNVREFATKLNCSELLESIDCYVKENFEEISQTSDFLKYPLTYMKELIGKEDLRVDNEEQIFEAVIKWVRASSEARKPELPELIRTIRMPLLQPIYLAKIVQREELIRTSMLCRDLLDEARNYNPFPEIRKSICSFPTEPRQSLKIIYVSEENNNSTCFCKLHAQVKYTAQYFDLTEEKWLTKESRTFDVNSGSVAKLRDAIYFFYWSYTMMYDPINNVYKILERVPTPRIYMGTTSFSDKIYVCGGRIGLAASNVVECFDPEKNEWSSVSSMRTARWGSRVITLGEHVFSLGGQDNFSVYDSVERYDPVAGNWRNVPPMLTGRCHGGAAAMNGKIYMCGGNTLASGKAGITATAEVYDPIKNKWKFISPMNTTRMSFTLLSCRGKLYALGGEDDKGLRLHYFDVYDPESDKWTWGPSSDTEYFTSGAVVMSSSNF